MDPWLNAVAILAPLAAFLIAAALRMASAALPKTMWNAEHRQRLGIAGYVCLGIGAMSLVFTAIVNGWLAGLLLIIFVMAAGLMVLVELKVASRQHLVEQAELLWLLATTIQNQGELQTELETYARGTFGKRRRSLLGLASRVKEGMPLSEIAVPQGLISDFALLEIQAGLNSGRLHESLKTAAIRQTREIAEDSISLKTQLTLTYMVAVLTSIMLIVAFLTYYIVPKFRKIFDDFGAEFPELTKALIGQSHTAINCWYWLSPFAYLMLAAVIVVEIAEFCGWRMVTQRLFGRWVARVFTPGLLRSLSHAVAANQNLDTVLSGMLASAAPFRLKNRVAVLREALSQGGPCWHELQRQGFLTAGEVGLLESSERVGNLSWTLVAIGDSIERRWMSRLQTILDLLGPMVILSLGAIVGFVVIAMFLPTVELLKYQ